MKIKFNRPVPHICLNCHLLRAAYFQHMVQLAVLNVQRFLGWMVLMNAFTACYLEKNKLYIIMDMLKHWWITESREDKYLADLGKGDSLQTPSSITSLLD